MKHLKKGLIGFLAGFASNVLAMSNPIIVALYGVPARETLLYKVLKIITPILGLIAGIIVVLSKKLSKKAKIIWICCIVVIVAILFCLLLHFRPLFLRY